MSWRMVKLEEICEINIGKTPSRNNLEYWKDGTDYWLSIADMSTGENIISTKEKITKKAINDSRIKLVKPNTILLSYKLSVGKVGISQFSLYTNEAIAALPIKNSKQLDTRYLLNVLKNIDFYKDADRAAKGLTLNKDKLKKIEIPLPSLAEQKRIAAILDKANEIKAKRELALVKFDELAQSIFIEMFGDPITNSHNLPIYKLGDIGVLERGVSKHRPRNAKELMGSDYPLIQTGDVANCAGYIFNHSYAYSELGLKQSKLWEAGTLCITIAANIAKTGILTFDACFPDSIVGFKAKNQATVEYVRVWLMFLQKTLEDNAPESAQKNINLSILRALEIPLPNIDQQVAFHKFLMAVKDKKEALVRSRQQIVSLNKSLQEQAFSTGFDA